MPCSRCQIGIEPRRKYCEPCKRAVILETKRLREEKKRRAAGVTGLNSPGKCQRCDAMFVRTSGARRYCPTCSAIAKKEVHRAANAKYAETRPKRKRDKPADIERRKRWASANREKCRLSAARYNESNRATINAKARERAKTADRKVYVVEWERRKRSVDPSFVLNQRMRQAVRRDLKNGKDGRSWRTLVGYGTKDLRAHLERQFTKGMTWENMGEWHIDHIIPLSSFVFETSDCPGFKAAWAITNLRPLWATDNLQKHARRLHLI